MKIIILRLAIVSQLIFLVKRSGNSVRQLIIYRWLMLRQFKATWGKTIPLYTCYHFLHKYSTIVYCDRLNASLSKSNFLYEYILGLHNLKL